MPVARVRSGRYPPAVVAGLNINGLGTVRALGRRGVPVIAVTSGPDTPSVHTRYAYRKIHCPNLRESDAALIDALREISGTLDQPAVVFPSSDLLLATLSEHREELKEHYLFPFGSQDAVRLIADKGTFYRFCQSHRIPIPRTWFPADPGEVAEVAREASFPCVIKPAIAGPKWREQGLKLLLVQSAEELVAQFDFAYEICSALVVQEVTPGPDSTLYFSLTYLNQAQHPLAMFTGRKLRQWVPHFGISSMAISEWHPEIAEMSLASFRALDYTGYASAEYKRHALTGELLMTEITMRTWYPHALSEQAGVNLPYLAYCDLHGFDPGAQPARFEEGLKWIDEEGDFKSAMFYWRHGELSLKDWLRSYRGKKRWALFALDDPWPGVIFAMKLPFRLMRELLGTLRLSFRGGRGSKREISAEGRRAIAQAPK